ncbi:MAG TPA: SDR family oxidoreductase [Stellaceae bacterium]|nr:SDR family oxidoreductase [Stellaceae bacterium]
MRNVIVTGGSRGLGLGIALRLREAGYRAITVARKQSCEIAADSGKPSPLHFWPCDLAELDALPDLVKRIRADVGPIYALVNNAGIGTSGVLANMRTRDIERLVRLNTVSPMVLTKHVVRSMMVDGAKRDGGRIVNISSIVASTGFSGLSAYSATKASLIGFTKSLARELGPLGITVNAVAPGFVDTAMTEEMDADDRERVRRRSPLGHLAEIDDVANAVEFLVSDKARNITGTVLTVDAGSTA